MKDWTLVRLEIINSVKAVSPNRCEGAWTQWKSKDNLNRAHKKPNAYGDVKTEAFEYFFL